MQDRISIIPHTHYDAAVFKTRAEYLEMGLPHILLALRTLKEDPRYRFALDQVCYIRPFLERFPEQEASFREFVAQGRLQITCGMDTMADVNIPSGESFVRQVLYGKGYCRERLGVEVTCGWGLDTFGHHPQMPQLLRKAGFTSYWFQRGVQPNEPTEFQWEGIDGSRVLCLWMPYSYGLFYGSPTNLPQFADFVRARYEMMKPFAATRELFGLAGADLTPPEPHLTALVDAFNRTADAPFTLTVTSPDEYLAALREVTGPGHELKVLKADLNPVFQGCYSSRIECKQRNRELERLLTSVEKSAAIANCLGLITDSERTERAWEPVLFNQFHDVMCGVQMDHVYYDTMRGYDVAEHEALDQIDGYLAGITSRIDTRGDGIPLVVYNTLGWARSDVAEAEVSFAEAGVWTLGLVDSAGQPLPVQITDAERYGDGGLKRVRVLFVARDVPALGYAVYHVLANPAPAAVAPATAVASGTGAQRNVPNAQVMHLAENRGHLANEHLRVEFDLWTGAVVSVRSNADGWEAIRDGQGNAIARERDGGDFWELTGALRGGLTTPSEREQAVPVPGQAEFSSAQVGDGYTNHGPVMAEFRIAHPFGSGWFTSRVRLYAGLERVDFQTKILNKDEWVRYRALFPTTIQGGAITHEIPFGAIERPGREFPAQNWIDYGDGEHGLALLNRGIPGNNVVDGVLMLSLMRATQFVSYSGGGYEPDASSATGQEMNKTLTFDYALVPHQGTWQDAHVYRSGFEFNNPLLVRKAAVQAGPLPARWGLLDVTAPNAVVSAVKLSDDGDTVVRVYEAAGRAVTGVRMRFSARVVAAEEANLLEDAEGQAIIDGDALRFDLAPFEIRTFKLRLEM